MTDQVTLLAPPNGNRNIAVRRWLIRVVAVASIAVMVVVAIVDAARGWASGGFYLLYGIIAAIFVVVGWLIAERRPSNALGPLLVAFGVLFAWYIPADLYLHLPGQPPAAAYVALWISVLDVPTLTLVALALLTFPDGRLPSPRWRWAIVASLAAIGLDVVGYVLDPTPFLLYPQYASPFGIPGFRAAALVYVAYALMLLLLLSSAFALLIRWRRGDTVERAQIKWVVAAAMVLLVTEVINVATFDPASPNAISNVLASVGIALIPLAMGVAILRYRLYEIDRIISRTIGYGLITGSLLAVFLLVNLGLQTVLSSVTSTNSIAVAVSTLFVAGLFTPIRRRVQDLVDRRFDRARYNGERMAGAFSERMRDAIDLPVLAADLESTVRQAMAPRHVGMWLRGGDR